MDEIEFKLKSELDKGGFDDFNSEVLKSVSNNEKLQTSINDSMRKAASSTDGLKKAFSELTAEEKKQLGIIEKLERQYEELQSKIKKAQSIEDVKKYRKEQQEVVKTLEKVNKATDPIVKSSKEMQKGFKGASSGVADLLGNVISVSGATALAVAAVKDIINLSDEFRQKRQEARLLTQLEGQALDQVVTKVEALSRAYDQDYTDVLRSANAVSKEFNISQTEALELISKGFTNGANISGDFLDTLKEYPAQFAAAGGSANDFVNVLINSTREGVFSDKGIDAVKEFNLRIKEQAEGTRKAIVDLLGEDEADELLGGVADGSISSIDALKRVSQEMNNTEVDSKTLQTVVADVFGGAGEDAGLRYLQSLKDIDTATQDLDSTTRRIIEVEDRRLALTENVAAAQQRLAKEYETSGNVLEEAGLRVQAVYYGVVTAINQALSGQENFFDALGDNVASSLGGPFALFRGESEALTEEQTKQVLQVRELTKEFNALNSVYKDISDGSKSLAFGAGEIAVSEEEQKAAEDRLLAIRDKVIELGGDVKKLQIFDPAVLVEGSDEVEGRIKEIDDKLAGLGKKKEVDRGDEGSIASLRFNLGELKKELSEANPEDQGLVASLSTQIKSVEEDIDLAQAKLEAFANQKIKPISQDQPQERGLQLAGFDEFNDSIETTEELQDRLKSNFEELQSVVGDLGNELDDALGIDGLGDLFSNLSVFFGKDLPADVDKSQAALQAAAAGISIISGALGNFYAERLEQSQQTIDGLDREIDMQADYVDQQAELAEKGVANNLETAQAEQDALIAQREEAIKEQERLQRRQAIVEALQQASALATTAAQMFASQAPKGLIGVGLAVGALATILSTFAKFKKDASAQITARDGYADILGGNRHEQGGNNLGWIEAEKGEAFGILSRTASARYGKDFVDLTNHLNGGGSFPSDNLIMPLRAPIEAAMNTRGGDSALVSEVRFLRTEVTALKKVVENRPVVYEAGKPIVKETPTSRTVIIPT